MNPHDANSTDTEASHSPGKQAGNAAATASWSEALVSFRWPLVVVALGLIALTFYLVTLRQAERAAGKVGELVGTAADRAESMARGFFGGNITEAFVSSIPEIQTAEGGRLELASAEITETFTRSDERRILWDQFSLGTTVSEIKVPVTYRYHLRLADPWRLEVSGGTCVVYAPQIRPTQPPAIHTDGMEKRSAESWLRFDAHEQLEALEKTITPQLIARARDEQHLTLVRETSRQAVAEFVRRWLLREDHWRPDRFHAVTVVFPDDEPSDTEALDITIELDEG